MFERIEFTRKKTVINICWILDIDCFKPTDFKKQNSWEFEQFFYTVVKKLKL